MSSAPDLSTIVSAKIHPAIGVARVGNSSSAYFIGPEVIEPAAEAPGFYRDTHGALKRQAARFRVYGYDAHGKVVAELNATNAVVTWSAHLANLKAAWYAFIQALDIPESAQQGIVSPRRNATLSGPQRAALAIDGGSVSVSGAWQQGGSFNGSFLGEPVYLGELRTDEAGRLIVLGGLGKSDSPTNAPLPNFANNDGWHDDTADGPVTASVVLQGRALPVAPAWVIVAPPNYAPGLKSVRTMHDLLRDVFEPVPVMPSRSAVSFQHEVLPIFQRMSALQWTNQGFANAFGHGAVLDFTHPEFLSWASVPLRIPVDLYAERRQQIANAFRNVDRDGYSPTPLPWLYGDAINLPVPPAPHVYSALSLHQQQALQAWAAGDFIGDWDPNAQPPRMLGAVPLAEQPAMLDRAAMDFCLADAFHPGCEITWPMRHLSMYSAPGRIAHAAPGSTEPDYGEQLTPQNILVGPTGPLNAQWPGGLTRWMAVPWQTDTASCLSGYIPAYDPYLPTFWPARVPNQVLDEPEYEQVVNPLLPREVRRVAFKIRRSWPGVLPGADHDDQVAAMVTLFGRMGITEQRPGVPNDPDFPALMQVTKLPYLGVTPLADAPATGDADVAATAAPAAPRAPTGRGVGPSRDGTWLGRFGARPRHRPG